MASSWLKSRRIRQSCLIARTQIGRIDTDALTRSLFCIPPEMDVHFAFKSRDLGSLGSNYKWT